jgi:hypothetical protein
MPNILGYRLSHLTSAPITLGQKIGLHPVRYGEANCTRISPPFIYGPDIQSTSTAAPLTLTTFLAMSLHAQDPSISFVVQVTVINYEINLEIRKGTSSHLRTT